MPLKGIESYVRTVNSLRLNVLDLFNLNTFSNISFVPLNLTDRKQCKTLKKEKSLI